MYSLKEPGLSAFKNTLDSMDRAYKEANRNKCIIHIKSYASYYHDKNVRVYFNDYIIMTPEPVSRDEGRVKIQSLNVKIPESGKLSLHNESQDFSLEKGHEFFFLIRSGMVSKGHWRTLIREVTREMYEGVDFQ